MSTATVSRVAARGEAEEAVEKLLRSLGEDPSREGLERTPARVAKALSFLTSGGEKSAADVLNGAVFSESYAGMVLVQDIEFYSLCEHHMLPFTGKAHIAYLPAGRVIGLSKLPRLLDVYARRLQVQERLTEQVAHAVRQAIRPRGVAVMLEAEHFCMMMRGVEKQHSRTTTTCWLGEFERDPSRKQEFLASVRGVAAAATRPAGREPREGRLPVAPAPVVPFPSAAAPTRIGVFTGRRPTVRRGTYPRRQEVTRPARRGTPD